MMVKGRMGLEASSSRAVRKHCSRASMALSLQHLPQAVPHVMGRRVHLHRIPKDLLCQAVPLQLVQDQTLGDREREGVSE